MNRIRPEDINLFEAYLEGEMDEVTRARFEEQLQEDVALAVSFDGYKKVLSALASAKETELREELRRLDQSMSQKGGEKGRGRKLLVWSASVAAIAVLVIGIQWYKYSKELQFVQGFWEPEPGLPVLMSESNRWNPAMNAYKTRRWKDARELLQKIPSDTATYFLGIVAYEQDSLELAESYFDELAPSSAWYGEAKFRLAIVLELNGRRSEAKRVLKQLKSEGGFNPDKISQLEDFLK